MSRGLTFAQTLVVETELLQRVDLEVLEHDVGRLGKLAHDLLAFRLVEAERDRALAAVHGEVVAGLLGVLAFRVLQERRSPAAGVVADAAIARP